MNEGKNLSKNPLFYIVIAAFVLIAVFIFELVRLNVLPSGILIGVIAILFILIGLTAFCLIGKKSGKVKKIIGIVLAFILAIVSGFGSFYLNVTYDSLNMMYAANAKEKKITSVYVLDNGVFENVNELDGHKIGIMTNFENSKGANEISKRLHRRGIEVIYEKYESGIKMVKDLKGQAIDAIICDTSFLATIEDFEEEKEIRNQVKSLLDYEYYVEKTKENKEEVNVTNTPFSVMISGIDTYGDIETTSRSDVNIIATINPTTRRILLVSIPRDYYVETRCEPSAGCAYGKKDKLTHTGLHGIETTEATLENLFNMTINYNARVNFSSVVNIVDQLGGVEVNNPYEFSISNHYFPQGPIHLNGEEALAFSRERYSFVEGDRERGRNQMRVMNGIIQKIVSPQILKNFSGIMNAIGNSFQTNMSVQDMMALVNMQLTKGGAWSVYFCSVNGTGGTDFAYELGDNAYVMYPDEKTIVHAKENMSAIQNGDIPPYVNQ